MKDRKEFVREIKEINKINEYTDKVSKVEKNRDLQKYTDKSTITKKSNRDER